MAACFQRRIWPARRISLRPPGSCGANAASARSRTRKSAWSPDGAISATAASQSCGDKHVAKTTDKYERPLPARLGLAAEFYKYTKLHELRFQRCTDCGVWRHLPRPMCGECGSFNYEWARSSGKGKVYSWITVTQAMLPQFND